MPDRGHRAGRGSARGGPRGDRSHDAQYPGPPAHPSGSAGRSEGARRGRGGRGGPGAYRQQQTQYQGMPAQSMAAQQVYYPVQSSMYYPPAAFGIPTAAPGLPAISQEQLQLAVQQQIEYYFSIANLVKDVFLRSKMNGEGWISLHVIASFNRVRMLTPDLAMIMQALLDSPTVELSGDSLFIRPRHGYQQWILPEAQRDASAHALPHMPGNTSSSSMKSAGQAPAGTTADIARHATADEAANGENTAASSSQDPSAVSGTNAPSTAASSNQNTAADAGAHTESASTSSSQDKSAGKEGSSKAEISTQAAEESSIQEGAPATPSNSTQERSASGAVGSPSPVDAAKDSQDSQQEAQPQRHTTTADAAAEEHGEEDMFEMDEVNCTANCTTNCTSWPRACSAEQPC